MESEKCGYNTIKHFQGSIKQISVKDDCNMLLDNGGDLYVWGNNSNFRLGID